MAQISINNLTFCYDTSTDYVFKNISLTLDTDWKLGLIGRNGRGKTTLLKLLAGFYEYTGSINSPADFFYFPYDISDESMSIAQLKDTLLPDAYHWELERELNLLGFDAQRTNQSYATLSRGERTKVLLALMFLKNAGFFLIDEPTTHLDLEGRRVVSAYLSKKNGFIVVSHDREFLDGCVTHIMSINRADISIERGNFTSFITNKQNRDSFEANQNHKLEREIDRLKASAKQSTQWAQKGHRESTDSSAPDARQMGFKEFHRNKAAKLASSAKSLNMRREKSIKEKSKLLKNIESPESIKLIPLEHYAQRLIELRDLSVCYADTPVFAPLNFEVMRGQRLWLKGNNGSGKSSIVKVLLGEAIPYSGTILCASGLIISYLPQHESIGGSLREYAKQSGVNETLFKSMLSKLDFNSAHLEKDISQLSEGQKKKVLLAKSLCQKAHLYIWDEPLNYIDIYSAMQIEELILTYRPTMLFTCHDAAFGKKISTDCFEL